jgi:hypothetical protein
MGHLAERYRVSEEAVRVLRRALERGGGRLAQFSHPELGGYGQWMPGMTQIGETCLITSCATGWSGCARS